MNLRDRLARLEAQQSESGDAAPPRFILAFVGAENGRPSGEVRYCEFTDAGLRDIECPGEEDEPT